MESELNWDFFPLLRLIFKKKIETQFLGRILIKKLRHTKLRQHNVLRHCWIETIIFYCCSSWYAAQFRVEDVRLSPCYRTDRKATRWSRSLFRRSRLACRRSVSSSTKVSKSTLSGFPQASWRAASVFSIVIAAIPNDTSSIWPSSPSPLSSPSSSSSLDIELSTSFLWTSFQIFWQISTFLSCTLFFAVGNNFFFKRLQKKSIRFEKEIKQKTLPPLFLLR